MPGTATTSSPRTTSGHDSRAERGIFASTNTSWIFFDRPASRSPSRDPVPARPGSCLKPWHAAANPPPAPPDFTVKRDRRAPEPARVVLPHRGDAAAEVEPLRAGRRAEQLVERRRPALREPKQVP